MNEHTPYVYAGYFKIKQCTMTKINLSECEGLEIENYEKLLELIYQAGGKQPIASALHEACVQVAATNKINSYELMERRRTDMDFQPTEIEQSLISLLEFSAAIGEIKISPFIIIQKSV